MFSYSCTADDCTIPCQINLIMLNWWTTVMFLARISIIREKIIGNIKCQLDMLLRSEMWSTSVGKINWNNCWKMHKTDKKHFYRITFVYSRCTTSSVSSVMDVVSHWTLTQWHKGRTTSSVKVSLHKNRHKLLC